MAELSPESDMHLELLGRFLKLKALDKVPLEARVEAFNRLSAKYREPHRRYHVLLHIHDGFTVLDTFIHLAERPDELALAWFYHDVIYDIGVPATQNERCSAGFLASELIAMGVPPSEIIYPSVLVLATTHDHIPEFNDAKLIVDIDLAGLGAPWYVFLENYRNVREECAHVPEDAFRKDTGEILRRFYDRTPLYYHPAIEKKLGQQAKDNLRRWLNRP